jgi:hypothetical protein
MLPVLLCAFSLCCYVAFILSNPALVNNDSDKNEPHDEATAIPEQRGLFSLEMVGSSPSLHSLLQPPTTPQHLNRSHPYQQLLSMEEPEGVEREQMAACDYRQEKCTDEQHALDEEANTSSLQRLKRNGEVMSDTDQRLTSPRLWRPLYFVSN